MKKNILFTGLFIAISTFTFAQLKVESAGVKVGAETTPVEALDVAGGIKLGAATNAANDATKAGTIQWKDGNFEGYDGTNWLKFAGSGASMWNANGSGEAYFNSNVGIGVNDPEGVFHVVGSATDRPRFYIDGGIVNGSHVISEFYRTPPGVGNAGFAIGYVSDGSDVVYTQMYAPGARDFALTTFNGGLYTPLYMTNDGNIGLGNNLNPTHTLDVIGDAFKTVGGDSWNVASDSRLKKEVKKYSKGLSAIMRLNPVTYYYNGKGGTSDKELNVGLIAQEFQKIEPAYVKEIEMQIDKMVGESTVDNFENQRLVKGTPEKYLSMNATPIKYMLINAVQEQQAIIQEQQAKVNSLEKKVAELTALVNKLLPTIEKVGTKNN